VSISINHHRQGEGPPLVLLHGVGHHWQGWMPVIDRLADEFDVIACDSPGFGRSAPLPPGIEPTIHSYVDAFEWFFAELGIERPHVAGNSMGGSIALELARRRAIRSAAAFSPAGFWSRGELRFCQLSLRALGGVPAAARPLLEALARTRGGRAALFAQMFGHPARMPASEAVATLRDAWASPALSATGYSFGSGEQLRNVPVTVAWGARDLLLPRRLQAPRARRMMPWATHVTLPTGHVPFFDDPGAVAGVIRASAAAATDAAAQPSAGAGR
jgi:pimeloyl-ACP methyl ester carboxylesterase